MQSSFSPYNQVFLTRCVDYLRVINSTPDLGVEPIRGMFAILFDVSMTDADHLLLWIEEYEASWSFYPLLVLNPQSHIYVHPC